MMDIGSKHLKKFIDEALAIELENANEAGTIGYMARVLTQATIPHKKVAGNEFTRSNGAFSLSILSPSQTGLPYGTIPRLLLAWITTEAVREKNPEIILGNNLSEFMRSLGLIPSWGRWGTTVRLKDQMQRLFSSSISCHYTGGVEQSAALGFNLVKQYNLWWHPKTPEQCSLWQSTVTLSKDFFEEIIDRPVPIDMRALKALKRSPLALDIYCWLTYRLSYLKNQTTIPWSALQIQFGSDYALDAQGTRNFKKAFLRELKKVSFVYQEAKLESLEQGLNLKPSNPHVKRLITL